MSDASRWLISIPIWGDYYIQEFARVGAPALIAAAGRIKEPVRFLVHTDRPDAVAPALPGLDVAFRAVPPKSTYVTLQESHAEAITTAEVGERVVLLNADLVVSVNMLEACARHFADGKSAIVVLGIRTAAGPVPPPPGVDPRTLLAWAWEHRHQIIQDLEWSSGRSLLPTNLFWSAGASVVARGFHLHPVAVVKHADISFQSTIDGDLLDCFPYEEIHVVTDPDDCSMCEVSPPAKRFPISSQILSPQRVAGSMLSRASEMHKWLFTHKIVVVGDGHDVTEDEAAVSTILERMRVLAGLQPSAPPPYSHDKGRVPGGRVASRPVGRHPPRRV